MLNITSHNGNAKGKSKSQPTVRQHFISREKAIIKKREKKKEINVGEVVEKLEPLCIASGSVKWPSNCRKQYGNS